MGSVWKLHRRQLAIVLLATCVHVTPAFAAADDPVLQWNDIAQAFIVVPAFTPVEQTRAMAIVHAAMHDAVNAVTGQYERYLAEPSAPAGISPEAAAIGAAYVAVRGVLNSEPPLLTAKFQASLTAHGLAAGDPGILFGEAVALRILQVRQGDGASVAKYPYVPPDAGLPGVWTPISAAPAAQALLPGWGSVTPFVLRSASQFRPEAPPALGSETYARDYNEVKTLGALVGSTRTEEQRQIALFWRASPTAIWNPVLRTAVVSRSMSLSDTAQVMALFYLAAADASVACWEAKYFYNFWRPEPAIVRGDEDGNDATAADASWRPLLLTTPPHPDYVSGHAANSGAMGFVLSVMFGDAPGYTIEATSAQNVGFIRYWQTFSQGVDEVIDARVYSGIHFRTADVAGARLGRQVARFVMTHALRPAR